MHSSHVQVLVDSGALGYFAWLIFILGVARLVYKRTKRKKDISEIARMQNVENLLVVFVILFRSLLGHVLVAHQLNMMIFLAIYIYATTYREQQDEVEENEDEDTQDKTVQNKSKVPILAYKKTVNSDR